MSESVYRQAVADLASLQDQPKAQVVAEIVDLVHSAHAAGEYWAAEVLARWDRAGADADYTAAHKALNSVTYIRRDGRRVRKTTSYSRPARSESSGEIVGMQMQAWWDMSRNELEVLRNDMDDQAERLADVVKALGQLIDAMDRHPDCVTAREAWIAEGRSLAEIDLEELAS